jgi:hypothetical protein
VSVVVALRVRLPDRPGALGLVASRIGAVRGDVLGIEILETIGTSVVDEFVVRLETAEVIDLMVAEITAVDGACVEHLRVVSDPGIDTGLSTLKAAVRCVEVDRSSRLEVLCDEVAMLFDARWVMISDSGSGAVVCARGEPALDLSGPQPRSAVAGELTVDLPSHLVRLSIGRADPSIHDRDRVRLQLLARIVDGLASDRPIP